MQMIPNHLSLICPCISQVLSPINVGNVIILQWREAISRYTSEFIQVRVCSRRLWFDCGYIWEHFMFYNIKNFCQQYFKPKPLDICLLASV